MGEQDPLGAAPAARPGDPILFDVLAGAVEVGDHQNREPRLVESAGQLLPQDLQCFDYMSVMTDEWGLWCYSSE
ncbi:hypothetical protein [Streptomyces sp. NPDC058953]|uniref:hypothetical protein n=1 Tax=unclassified Streptomyces TaxID=2593676 RepID=UPI0036BF782F